MLAGVQQVGDKDRKVLKIPGELHQAIDIESAMTRVPMYVVIQRAWDAYLRGKGEEVVKVDDQDSIEAGLSPKQLKLLRRYSDLLRSGKDPEFARIIETMLDRAEVGQPKERTEESRKAG